MKTKSGLFQEGDRSPVSREGFSLVEVVFALAIASFGFLTLLGLLPSGLEMARNSADLAAEARITQHLSGELQSTSWDELDWNGYGQPRFFNDQGVEIPKNAVANGGLETGLSYVATIELPASGTDISLPSGSSKGRRGTTSSAVEPCLRRARIHVASSADPGFKFGQSQPGARLVRSYTVMVAESNG
jgi:uncharacterized protein (TIGR02598 family)